MAFFPFSTHSRAVMLSPRLVPTPLCILPPTSCWNGPSTLKGKGSSHVSCAPWAVLYRLEQPGVQTPLLADRGHEAMVLC
jgi:hypothetical protein